MRRIGHVQGDAAARTFGDFLVGQQIAHEMEPDGGEAWAVWIRSDEEVARAGGYLKVFTENPADALFQGASQQAAAVRQQEQEDYARYRGRVKGSRALFPSLKGYRFGPLTYSLIFVSAIVFLVMKFGTDFDAVHTLWFSEYAHEGKFWQRLFDVPEWRTGQLWRLFTPMFIHLSILHILFNMMWLADLGSMIEDRQSTALLGRLVIGLSIGSNAVQYGITGDPHFGGMSGVIYGLVGYIWMRGKYDTASGLYLHKQTVITSMIWFFLCFTGAMGPIANGAHAGGLLLGLAWGRLASMRAHG